MANDAELSVGIEDNLTPVLSKMAAQTRAFGAAMGAESKAIDKAVRGVTKSINDLNSASGGKAGKASPLAANIAATRREMEKMEALAKQASRLEVSNASFSGYRLNGKSVKASTAQEILGAAAAYKKLEEQLRALEAVESRMAASGKAAAFQKSQAAMFTIDPATLNKAARDRATLQKVYEGMWSDLGDQSKLKRTNSWWPPEMLKGPQQFTDAMMNMSNSVRYAMYDVSRNAAIGGAAILALGVGAVVVAARWERAFADVERTVQGTPRTLERIEEGLVSLSQTIPVAFTDLAQIASVGGQMGISAQGIVAYTETIAKLTATTNLTADAASKALGRFKAFFAEADSAELAVTDQTFSNLASSILKVGVNSVATESGIVNVATQISSMGSYAGLTADQVIGLAGALSSVGVPPELSRGVITRLFNTIGEAVNRGGTRLQAFADLAGISSDEFARAWGTERFGYVFTNVVAGLGEVHRETNGAVGALHDLGITSVRDVPVLIRLANAAGEAGIAGGLLAQTMNDARSGWRDNIELSLQYSKISDTLVEKTKVLFQNFEALFAAMGKSSVGPVKAMVEGLTELVKGFTTLAASPVGQTLGVITVAASVLAGTLLLIVAGGARAFAAMQGLAAGLQAVGINAATATPLVRGLGIAMGTLGAVAALAAVVGTIIAITNASQAANNAITDTQGALAAMKSDAESGKVFVSYTDGLKDAEKASDDMSSQADNLGEVLGFTQDELYGAATAAKTAEDAIHQAALGFGKDSLAFAKSSITGQKAFTDLFSGEFGTGFADRLTKNGFDMDKALRIAANGDKAAVRAYIESVFGEFGNEQTLPWNVNADIVFDRELENRAITLLDILSTSGGEFANIAKAAYASGEGIVQFSSAIQMTESSMEDFEVANEAAIKSMSGGFQKFVDSGSLITLAQQLGALRKMEPGEDKDKAAQEYADAWTNAYGGAAFSLNTYMDVFRRAAGEQEKFVANIQTLLARGVDPAIIADLAAMGPQAAQLVQALVSSTDKELDEYVALYGKTGFESMVAMAAGQLAAEFIVREAAKSLSVAQLQELSADLASGTPLIDAMSKWNLDAQGKPMKAPVSPPLVPPLSDYARNQWARQNAMFVPVTPYLTQSRITVQKTGENPTNANYSIRTGWAQGGYTGSGGKYQYAGPAHRGEYIHPQEDVDQRTGLPKTSTLVRMLNGGRPARRGGGAGFAGGGFAASGAGVTFLSPDDRALLRQIRDSIGVYIDGRELASVQAKANFTSTRQGQG